MDSIEDLLAPFLGRAETDRIELKREPIRTVSLVERIQGAINAPTPECLFLLGVEEVEGRVELLGIVGLDYPLEVKGRGRFSSFDDYRRHLMSSLSSNTIPWQSGLVEIDEVFSADGEKRAIAIRVNGGALVQNNAKGHFPVREGTSLRFMQLEEILSRKGADEGPDVSWEPFRSDYFATVPRDQKTGRMIGFFCAATPVGGGISLDSPWDDERLVHKRHSLEVQLGTAPLQIETLEGADYDGPFKFVPIQNGAMGRWDRRFGAYDDRNRIVEDVCAVYVRDNGAITVVARTTELSPAPFLNVRWVLADVANTLSIIDRVRAAAGRTDQRYALLIELRYDDQVSDEAVPVSAGEWRFCDLSDEQGRTGRLVSSDPKSYGPFMVGMPEEFPAVLSEIFEGLETSAGRRPVQDISFRETVPTISGRDRC